MANRELKIKQGGDINTVQAKETPGRGQLNSRDFLLGLGMAVATPMLIQVYEILMAFLDYQPVEFAWRFLVKSGIGAGASYLGKNLWDKSVIVMNLKDLGK